MSTTPLDLDAKTEFKIFFIELNRNKWFTSVFNCDQLQSVINSTYKSKGKPKIWEYECEKLIFRKISTLRHVRPKAIKPYNNATLELSVFFEGEYEFSKNKIYDQVQKLGCSFLIKHEELKDDGVKIQRESQWHLDKHDPKKPIQVIHPLHHFEYGGSVTTEEEGFNYGHFIVLDTPRLMYPPLDLVLAIDFVVKNFYEYGEYKVLTETDTYKRCVKNAQMRLWRPYALAFASNFHNLEGLEIDGNFASHIIESPYNNKAPE